MTVLLTLLHFFYDNGNGNMTPYTDRYGNNTIEIEVVFVPTKGRTTLDITKHEAGHTSYQASNTTSYYKYLKTNGRLGVPYDGHAPDDPSGKRALQYENLATEKPKR